MPNHFDKIKAAEWAYVPPPVQLVSDDLTVLEAKVAGISTGSMKNVQWTSTDPAVRPADAPAGAPVVFWTAAQPTAMLDGDVWTQAGGPAVSLTAATTSDGVSTASFVGPKAMTVQTVTLRLTLTDGKVATSSDDVTITVPPWPRWSRANGTFAPI